MSKVILYVATSKDGFIADKNGGVDWLPHPNETIGEDYDYKNFYARIDAIVMGSRSYEQILGFGEWLWPGKPTYVFSSRSIDIQRPDIFLAGTEVNSFMHEFQVKHPTQTIWLLGGAKLAQSFAKQNLIDECIITIFPTVLNEGVSLSLDYEGFELIKTKKCSGNAEDVLQKTYLKSSTT